MKNTADVLEAAPGMEENWQLQQIEVKTDPPPHSPLNHILQQMKQGGKIPDVFFSLSNISVRKMCTFSMKAKSLRSQMKYSECSVAGSSRENKYSIDCYQAPCDP